MDLQLILLGALFVIGMSGVPGLFTPKRSDVGQTIAHLLHTAGSIAAAAVAIVVLLGGSGFTVSAGFLGDRYAIATVLDPLAAAFLLPVLVVTNLSSLFGLDYWRESAGAIRPRYVRVLFGLLTAGLAWLLIAADAISFLVAWEMMALPAFFLITTTEQKSPEVRRAGWIYFVTTHVSTLLLFGLFGFAWAQSGGSSFADLAQAPLDRSATNAIFILALAGFGIKAGVFPGHFWLPPAHASAPSHVSALMSGVLIKIGIYGILRTVFLLRGAIEPWWGIVVLVLGVLSAVLGVAFALGQHDLKRLLAYHSIENIGIILIGVGVMLIGYSHGSPLVVMLGLTGALLHVWNHALFKSLLFLSAGAVVHAADTREIDALGGLGKRMPRTAFFFLLGAIAICGLPPLNGFVSELVIYLGLLQGLSEHSAYIMAGGCIALAVVGGLALGCFVKAFGCVFLGSGRSEHAQKAHEASLPMQCGMAGLAAGCLFIAFAPRVAESLLRPVIAPWLTFAPFSESAAASAVPYAVTLLNPILAAVLVFACVLGAKLFRGVRGVTWDCGFAYPARSMQYTASSFAQMFVKLLSGALRPTSKEPALQSFLPEPASFESAVPDVVLDRALFPSFRVFVKAISKVKVLQHGILHAYVLYVLIAFLVLLIAALRAS